MPNTELPDELPDDPWSRLLIGHQWPSASALTALQGAARNRAAIAEAMDRYADTLADARHGPLAVQDGITAEAVRDRFRTGETQARDLAARNTAKRSAYIGAHDQVSALRAELSGIARDGRGAIAEIQASGDPMAAKIARITAVVIACQTAANLAGGKQAANLLESVQRVLNASELPGGARRFAAARGVDADGAFGSLPSAATTEASRAVERILDGLPTGVGAPVPFAAGPPAAAAAPGQALHAAAAGGRTDLRPPPVTATPVASPGTATPGSRAGLPPSGPVTVTRAAVPVGAASTAAATATAGDDALHRTLAEVARQEPRLRWIIGRTGTATTLTTDLAGGWVPPQVEIPAGVTLLGPPARSGDLTAMIGPADAVAVYLPGQPIPPARSIPMSLSGRQIEPVADLAGRIRRATAAAAGLPRLAHTLVAATGGERRDDETRLLGELAAELGARVLARYPAPAAPADLARWQLLAAVDGLLSGRRTLANYHFGWFAVR